MTVCITTRIFYQPVPWLKKNWIVIRIFLLSSIQSLLKPLIGYMKLSVEVFYQKDSNKENSFKELEHFKGLQRFLGDLFEKEYNKYVSFNLEYVNRHSVSGNITLARKKFIDLLISNRGKSVKDIENLIEGRGPDYAISHTIERLSKSDYYNFFKEYKKILSEVSQGISGEALLDKLISPPYGLRLGVIPLFVALADLYFKQPVSHYFDSAYVKDLDGDHYDLLMKYPRKVKIHYTPINTRQQRFLDGLGKIFNSSDLSINSVIEGLLRWRKTIPESTKLASSLSKPGRKLLIQIDSSKEPDKLLFEGIPECFEKTNLTSKTNLNEIQELLNQTKKVKNEIDLVYRTLLLDIKADLVSFIIFINKQCLNRPSKSLIINENFIKSSQKTLSQVKDYPFSVNTNRFIGRVLHFDPSKPDQYFLETVSDALTGSSPRHWNAQGYSQFQFAMKQVKTEIELACEIASPNFKGQSVLAFIDRGEDKKTFVKLGSHFDIDQSLARSVEKVKIILDSLDDIDKKKAILAILQLVDVNSLETKKTKTPKKKRGSGAPCLILVMIKKEGRFAPYPVVKTQRLWLFFLKNKIPNLEYVFCDTGSELPETYEYLDKLEAFLGQKIVRLNSEKNFDYLLKQHSDYLPSPRARWCTMEMKIKSFERYIGNDSIESYIGIRADEYRQGYISQKDTILPRYPFKEEGIDLSGVNEILKKSGIGLPKYYEWRARSGCYFCFFQRKIEWVGLLEKHPKLFKKAKWYEKQNYKGDHVSFTWVDGSTLEDIERDREKIKLNHKERMEKAKKNQKGSNITDVFRDVVSEDDQEDACLICDL